LELQIVGSDHRPRLRRGGKGSSGFAVAEQGADLAALIGSQHPNGHQERLVVQAQMPPRCRPQRA
jgi:hypothetical protein